eukprot:c14419_g1_i1 orf=2-262(-)
MNATIIILSSLLWNSFITLYARMKKSGKSIGKNQMHDLPLVTNQFLEFVNISRMDRKSVTGKWHLERRTLLPSHKSYLVLNTSSILP